MSFYHAEQTYQPDDRMVDDQPTIVRDWLLWRGADDPRVDGEHKRRDGCVAPFCACCDAAADGLTYPVDGPHDHVRWITDCVACRSVLARETRGSLFELVAILETTPRSDARDLAIGDRHCPFCRTSHAVAGPCARMRFLPRFNPWSPSLRAWSHVICERDRCACCHAQRIGLTDRSDEYADHHHVHADFWTDCAACQNLIADLESRAVIVATDAETDAIALLTFSLSDHDADALRCYECGTMATLTDEIADPICEYCGSRPIIDRAEFGTVEFVRSSSDQV